MLQQVDIRMRSYGLRQLVDDKSIASCQQIIADSCKLIISTGFLQVALTSCNKSANDKLQQRSLILTDLLQIDEIDKFVVIC